MRRRKALACLGAALPAAALAAQSCRPATQMTLDLRTNVECKESRGAEIIVSSDAHTAEQRAALLPGEGARFPSATTTTCLDGRAPHEIGTLVITPKDGNGAVVVVSAFGAATLQDCTAGKFAKTCIVARRRFTFAEHRALSLPIVLDPDCAGIPCNESSTCFRAKCVSSEVDCSSGTCDDPGLLPDGGAAPEVDAASPILDGGTGIDASDGGLAVADAGTDAPADATPDAPSDGAVGPAECPRPSCNTPDGGVTTCAAPATCCYDGPLECQAAGTCGGGVSACCRDVSDCDNGDVCCASTPTPQAGTVIACRPLAECTDMSTVVCSAPSALCRGPTDTTYKCFHDQPYVGPATAPGYFFCHS